MSKLLQTEVDRLHERLLGLCAMVEKKLAMAVRAMEEMNPTLAREVIESDSEVDRREVEIEEDGLKILALYQPVAIDLRVIVATIKITSDLERIGDLANGIARRALALRDDGIRPELTGLIRMADRVASALKRGIDSLVQLDMVLAREVIQADKVIDEMNAEFLERGEAVLQRNPAQVHNVIQLMFVSKSLERIGDHATNIAEDVVYMVTGDIVRHNPEALRQLTGSGAVPEGVSNETEHLGG